MNLVKENIKRGRFINSKVELAYKICIFGESGVGKTSLVRRFITKKFDEDTKSTLGAAIHIKNLEMERFKLKLQIWDFGGEDKFRFLLPSYAVGAFGGIFMYDITRKNTLKKYKEWVNVFKSAVSDDRNKIPILLVGGKSDLKNRRECKEEDINIIIDSNYFFDKVECSSKIDEKVEFVFKKLINEIFRRFKGTF
ncbi:MAG: GTP-binding protein [Promethearchaeota archaeon]|nr:MAG: GTP-binding protein [Candidatus Lokiarchaeota archaeon]